jgi:two-component system response regulator FixJ
MVPYVEAIWTLTSIVQRGRLLQIWRNKALPVTDGSVMLRRGSGEVQSEATIDIVEDDRAARESLGQLCQAAGYRVRLAGTAEEYLQFLHVPAPACVLIDLRLPGMSGLALLDELRRSNVWLPGIVLCAVVDVPTAINALRLGALTVLEKPVPQDELLSAISFALEVSSDLAGYRQLADNLKLLTDRERVVLDMLANGELYKAIAQHLDIGIRTVERIRERILKKTSYSSIPPLIHDVGMAQGLTYWKKRASLES